MRLSQMRAVGCGRAARGSALDTAHDADGRPLGQAATLAARPGAADPLRPSQDGSGGVSNRRRLLAVGADPLQPCRCSPEGTAGFVFYAALVTLRRGWRVGCPGWGRGIGG